MAVEPRQIVKLGFKGETGAEEILYGAKKSLGEWIFGGFGSSSRYSYGCLQKCFRDGSELRRRVDGLGAPYFEKMSFNDVSLVDAI